MDIHIMDIHMKAITGPCWLHMVQVGPRWSWLAPFGQGLPCFALFDPVWSWLDPFGPVWPGMGPPWVPFSVWIFTLDHLKSHYDLRYYIKSTKYATNMHKFVLVFMKQIVWSFQRSVFYIRDKNALNLIYLRGKASQILSLVCATEWSWFLVSLGGMGCHKFWSQKQNQ